MDGVFVSTGGNVVNRINCKKYRIIFFSVIIFGILAHGMILFCKISFHDDICAMFDVGTTLPSGRWFLEIIKRIQKYIYGSPYSTPVFNGVLSLVFIAISCCIISDLLDIENKINCVALGGVFAVYPVVTSLFGYMYTAPFYMFSLMLAIISCQLICIRFNCVYYLLSMILLAISLGIYQAYLPFCLTIYLIRMLLKCEQMKSWKSFICYGCYYLFNVIGGLILYLLYNFFFLTIWDARLSDYKGINDFGTTNLKGYIVRIYLASKEFIFPSIKSSIDMYPMIMRKMYYIVLILTAVSCTSVFMIAYRNCIRYIFRNLCLLILFPITVNFIFVICDYTNVSTLMVFSQIMILIFMISLLEKVKKNAMGNTIRMVGIFVMFFMILFYTKYANICYLKADYMQKQTISYFERLIVRIESLENYSIDMPVLFIDSKKEDKNLSHIPEFDIVTINPYAKNNIINEYSWREFMQYWCGYTPLNTNVNMDFYEDQRIMNMPTYPDDGSIRIIDNIIVVNFR